MEGVLQLMNSWQTICIWNLPSDFTKDQLKSYFEEKDFHVKRIVLLPRDDCTEAAVQLANAGDVVRIVNSEHSINETRMEITPATTQVFRSVNALINHAWMDNPRVKQALDNMMDVKVERKKDGIHLIAPLQKIVQIEEQLRNLLVNRLNPVSVNEVLHDNWQQQIEVPEHAEGFEDRSAEDAEIINRILAEECDEGAALPNIPSIKSQMRRRPRNQRRNNQSHRFLKKTNQFPSNSFDKFMRNFVAPEETTDQPQEPIAPIAELNPTSQNKTEVVQEVVTKPADTEPTPEDLLLINQLLDEDSFLPIAEEEPTLEPRPVAEDAIHAEPSPTLVKAKIIKVVKPPAVKIEKQRPQFSCDLCFTLKDSVFVCSCDFEVCEECKKFNSCLKCGNSFDAAKLKE
ncbi:hypothetical protein CAPTEDRAFT_186915 [Capitella teleta]|uniref:RRM domain-containing protein n=1 Tax=Capitella teleta TaxID=283909 RepID=R7TN91_CAPTE|nr:hypothetical protein CAPTEDRAFT_186915 [Capitella teleta]|eukprot:ELT92550.1 hypothetical protein CAPTEDRAFT_186915 [Capitella teleta]